MRSSIEIDLGGTHLLCGSYAGMTPYRNVPVAAAPPDNDAVVVGAGKFALGGW